MSETQLGKYHILEEIGRGGFATVYRARDTTLEREVALKVLDPLLMRDETWVARFHREAKAVARLKHPHIVTIHEIGGAGGRLFIAMELIEGPGLRHLIAERGRLSWDEMVDILAQVADALDYAHGEFIIHRDLKPGNILLDERSGAMLTDFGFARLVGESSMSVSLSGGVVGTPAYIAPEVWDGETSTLQTDLYALACVVYEMLTGEVLFGGKTPSVVMRKHLLDGPQFPAEWPEGVPAGVAEVLCKALAREPGERYRSAGKMMAALRAAARAEPVVEAAPAEPTPAEPGFGVAQPEVHGGAGGVGAVSTPSQVTPSPRVGRGGRGVRAIPEWAWGVGAGGGLILVALLCLGVALGPRLFETASAPTARPAAVPTKVLPTATLVPTPRPAATPGAPSLGDTWTRPADGMVMVYVPAGEFEMGSTEYDDEQPVHTGALDGFWIDQTEVAAAQFRAFAQATNYETTAEQQGWGWVWVESAGEWQQVNGINWQHPQGPGSNVQDDHPVVQVSWDDAQAYCEWAEARLPTEAEWEYAARGPEGRIYPWGDSFEGERLNYCDANCPREWKDSEYDDGYALTAPVGSYPAGASWCGALDMAGNVWEWVADWYDDYPSGRQVNPAGPSSSTYRVLRGGSWFDSRHGARSAFRYGDIPDNRFNVIGFRCCVSPTSSP